MTSANLRQWIRHPETLSRDTLYELRNLLARYPYFHSLRLLYLKNLYVLHDINFGAELRKAILYIADRRMLFYLIEGKPFPVSAKGQDRKNRTLAEEPSVDRTLTLIDAFLATAPEEVTNQTDLDYSVDYTAYLLNHSDAEDTLTEAVPKLKGQDLIDGFIAKNENEPILGIKATDWDAKPDEKNETNTSEKKENDIEEEQKAFEGGGQDESANAFQEDDDDSCFTETLAKIYIKQRRYSKALEIIKKLSLKYPKKNAYFADQIRFLEKLIINANSK